MSDQSRSALLDRGGNGTGMRQAEQSDCQMTGRGDDSRVCLCGVSFDAISMSQVIDRVDQAIRSRTSMAISVVNVAKAVNMRTDPLLRESVASGDLILADGMPLVWLSRLRPRSLPQRVAGIDLMFELFALADRQHLRVYLLARGPRHWLRSFAS